MFASANKAEEHNPWAIIRIKDPCQPHVVFDMVPAVRRPIWPTLE